MIDMASVYAERYRKTPQALQAAVLGQSPDPRLDPYTALNALKLVNESNRMMMAGQAQQPTSSPSLVAQNMAPQAGLGAMVPGAMGQMGQAPQGMPPQAPAAPAPVMAAKSGGLASMPTKDFGYAQGGIVAFNGEDGSLTLPPGTPRDEEETGTYDPRDSEESEGSPNDQAKFNAYLMRQLKELEGYDPKELSDKEQGDLYEKFLAREQKLAGPDIYKPAMGDLQTRREAIPKNERYGQGLALISAAGQMLKGRNIAEGASNAAPAFAQQMAEAKRATIQEQRSIEQMQFSYADAQRKEKAGMHRAAQASVDSARKFQQDANKANFDKRRALADLAVKGSQANKPRAAGAGGAGPKLAERLADAEEAYALDPSKENKARLAALSSAASKMKTSFSTGEIGAVNAATRFAPTQARIDADVIEKLGDFKDNDRAYNKARRAGNTTETNRLLQAEETRLRAAYTTPAAGNAPAPKPSAAPTPTTPKPTTATKVVSMADVNATVTASGRTKQEVMDALKANGYTIK
jgi:hypothetical protein